MTDVERSVLDTLKVLNAPAVKMGRGYRLARPEDVAQVLQRPTEEVRALLRRLAADETTPVYRSRDLTERYSVTTDGRGNDLG